MTERIRQECCEMWATAHQSGTDNEGYDSVIHYGLEPETVRTPYIGYLGVFYGTEAAPVKFCPWCGAKKDVS